MRGADKQPTEAVFEALTDKRRQNVIVCLACSEQETMTINEVSEELATTPGSSVETIKTSLHHIHLPKLEEAGLVEYDERSEAIRYRSSESIRKLCKSGLLECPPQVC